MQNSNHSGYTNFDGSADLAPDAEFGRRSAQMHHMLANIQPEHWMYLASGVILALGGLVRRGPVGLIMSALGGGLLYQGITGVNPLQHLLNLPTGTRVNDSNAASASNPQQESLDIQI